MYLAEVNAMFAIKLVEYNNFEVWIERRRREGLRKDPYSFPSHGSLAKQY